MRSLRNIAKGQPCYLRLPGCSYNGSWHESDRFERKANKEGDGAMSEQLPKETAFTIADALAYLRTDQSDLHDRLCADIIVDLQDLLHDISATLESAKEFSSLHDMRAAMIQVLMSIGEYSTATKPPEYSRAAFERDQGFVERDGDGNES